MNYSLGNMLGGNNGSLNPDKLSLNLQFATDKSLTARKGPTPTFTRASTATFVGSDGLIQSAAINAARFDHNPTTLASLGLRIEQAVTNLTKRSDNDFSNAYWNSTANNVTAVDSVTTSPTGVASTASSITEIAGVSVTRHIHQTTGEFTPAASSAYTMSAWVKQPPTNPVRYVQLAFWVAGFGSTAYMNYDIQTGAVGTGGAGITASSIVAYPDGWYRISATATSLASPGSSGFQLGFSTTSGAVRTEAYTVVSPLKSIYLWGAQVEQISFPTSYIPTTTSQLTRSGDLCSITGAAFTGMYNASAGTAVIRSSFRVNNTGRPFSFNNGSTTNVFEVFNGTQLTSTIISGGASQYTGTPNTTMLEVNTFALAAEASSAMASTNGTLATAGTGIMPVGIDRLNIGNRADGARTLNGHISSLRYYKKRLANAKLQTLTA
jgi:hypothetical protein